MRNGNLIEGADLQVNVSKAKIMPKAALIKLRSPPVKFWMKTYLSWKCPQPEQEKPKC